MNTLKDLKPGQKGKVSLIMGKGAIKRRILDMGVTRGIDIFVEKVAPLGDPIEIKVRGYNLTLRKDDAANIVIDTF